MKLDQVLLRYQPARGVPLHAWLSEVFRNYFIQLGRRRQEEPCPDLDAIAASGCSLAHNQDRLTLDIDQVMDTLLPSDGQRRRKIRIFKQYWREGYTMTELAHQEGVATSTVHRWLTEVRSAFGQAWASAPMGPAPHTKLTRKRSAA